MMKYASIRGLRRLILTVPALFPHHSSYWINFVTTVPAGVVMPRVEELKNEVVCKNDEIRELIPIRLVSMDEAIRTALSEMVQGSENLVSCQSCLRT
jgi:hypothetical protein